MRKYDIVGELQSYLVEGMPIPAYKIKNYMLWVVVEWEISSEKERISKMEGFIMSDDWGIWE